MGIKEDDAEAGAVATAPRVTLAQMEAEIAFKTFIYGDDAARTGKAPVPYEISEHLYLMTLCILVLRSGFVVIGKSAPASPENFDRELGEKFAYQDAIRECWPLFGFYLKQRLADGESWPPAPKEERFEGGVRIDPQQPDSDIPF